MRGDNNQQRHRSRVPFHGYVDSERYGGGTSSNEAASGEGASYGGRDWYRTENDIDNDNNTDENRGFGDAGIHRGASEQSFGRGDDTRSGDHIETHGQFRDRGDRDRNPGDYQGGYGGNNYYDFKQPRGRFGTRDRG